MFRRASFASGVLGQSHGHEHLGLASYHDKGFLLHTIGTVPSRKLEDNPPSPRPRHDAGLSGDKPPCSHPLWPGSTMLHHPLEPGPTPTRKASMPRGDPLKRAHIPRRSSPFSYRPPDMPSKLGKSPPKPCRHTTRSPGLAGVQRPVPRTPCGSRGPSRWRCGEKRANSTLLSSYPVGCKVALHTTHHTLAENRATGLERQFRA